MNLSAVMIRTEWIVGLRNKLSSLSMECESSAAESTKLSEWEKYRIQKAIHDIVLWIDERIKV